MSRVRSHMEIRHSGHPPEVPSYQKVSELLARLDQLDAQQCAGQQMPLQVIVFVCAHVIYQWSHNDGPFNVGRPIKAIYEALGAGHAAHLRARLEGREEGFDRDGPPPKTGLKAKRLRIIQDDLVALGLLDIEGRVTAEGRRMARAKVTTVSQDPLARLSRLRYTQPGWANGRGSAPAHGLIAAAEMLLERWLRPPYSGPAPFVCPTLTGGLTLEWPFVSVELTYRGTTRVYFEAYSHQASTEGELGALVSLMEWLQREIPAGQELALKQPGTPQLVGLNSSYTSIW